VVEEGKDWSLAGDEERIGEARRSKLAARRGKEVRILIMYSSRP
jgi:hypothetical protein